MKSAASKSPSQSADRFIIRFHNNGQRDALKRRASKNKRSLNAELLFLLEKGIEFVDSRNGTWGA
jgi:hypothetical protein